MKTRLLKISLSIGLILALAAGGYFLARKFVRDRESLANFDPRAYERHQVKRAAPGAPVTRVYTEKELEEARKKGTLPPGMTQPAVPNTAGNDAVQRSLRTLDEINRINEMNRRLMEQQQRNQR